MVSFEIAGDKEQTSPSLTGCVPYIGPTLGGVESIVQQQALFISLDAEERRASGVATPSSATPWASKTALTRSPPFQTGAPHRRKPGIWQ